MKRVQLFSAACALIFVSCVASSQGAEKPASDTTNVAKNLVLQYKCNSCHTIKSAGVAKKAADDEEKSEKTPPDLSSVGLSRSKDWVTNFLLKKETIKGAKHMKKFRGTDVELSQIAGWLVTLKEDTTKSAKPKGEGK